MASLVIVFAIFSFCVYLNTGNCVILKGNPVTRHRFVKDKCKDNVKKTLQNVKCKLRDTIVPLDVSNNSFMIIPDKVLVKRCGGYVSRNYICMPDEVENITFSVRKFNEKTLVCENIKVVQHLKCKHGCLVTKENCTEMEKYDRKNCACVCANHHEKNSCVQSGKIWHKSSCSCSCEKSDECSNGTHWNSSECRCEMDTRNFKYFNYYK